MNTLQILIIAITTIGILASIVTLWKKGLLLKHKKKIVATIAALSLISGGGVLLLIPGNIIVVPAGATAYSVWFKSSTHNTYVTTNTSMPFSQIVIDADYLMFNSTIFVSNPTYRLNITIMYIASGTPAVGARCLGLYSGVLTAQTVSYVIGGFLPLTEYDVKKNNTYMTTATSNSTGYITFSNTFVNNKYSIKLDIYRGVTISYDTTIRKQGVDYFIWFDGNTTASIVGSFIAGFNGASEYIALFSDGVWIKYYGDGSGINWNVYTFDVIQTYLADGAGTVSITMAPNIGINYNAPRTVNIVKQAYGYKYVGYSNTTVDCTMEWANTTYLHLPSGYWLALWNETTYTWNYWISGFAGNKNQLLQYSNIVMVRIDADKTWII